MFLLECLFILGMVTDLRIGIIVEEPFSKSENPLFIDTIFLECLLNNTLLSSRSKKWNILSMTKFSFKLKLFLEKIEFMNFVPPLFFLLLMNKKITVIMMKKTKRYEKRLRNEE